MKTLITIAALLALAGCSDPDVARKALADAGYTKIELGGYAMIGCSESDDFSTKFRAVGPTGRPVEGVVCSGLFKGATIRTF